MSPEEQARLLEEAKDQMIRGVADLLTLKAKVEGSMRGAAGVEAGGLPPGVPTMGDYLLDLTRLGVTFYRSVLDLNAAYFEKISAPAAKRKRKKSARIVHKAIVSAKEARVSFDVELENKSKTEGRYVFLASDFRPREGGDSLRPPITIDPPRPLVGAGECVNVKISLPVAGVLQPGQKYKGRISVRGPTECEIVLRIRVKENEEHEQRRA